MSSSVRHQWRRSQSAMEYLMTYGWSILIVAVVLGALFQLGVFNSANFAPRAPTGNCKILRVAGMSNLEGTCSGVLPQSVAVFNQYSSCTSGNAPIVVSSIGQTTMSRLTIAAWVYITTPSNTAGLFHLYSNNCVTGNYCGIWADGTGGIFIGAGNTVANYPSALVQGRWSFIALALDGAGNAIAYSNGNAGILSTWSGPLTGITYFSMLGYSDGCADTSAASISNVQIYNASLDANQITALYQEGIGGAPIAPQSVVGWWPLNGDTKDYSGGNNAGMPTNVVYSSQWTSGYTQP